MKQNYAQSESTLAPEIVDGFTCYAPLKVHNYSDYPEEGFEVFDEELSRTFWGRSRARVLKLLVRKFLPENRTNSFLEIGCGTGINLAVLQEIPNIEVTGSDVYLRALQCARKKVPTMELIQIDATDIPFCKRYDAVGAFDVLEHLEADTEVIRSATKALRAGGLLFITVPQHAWLWSNLDELVNHKRRYSRRELESKLVSSGLEIVFSSSFIFALFPLMVAQRLSDKFKTTTNDTQDEISKRACLPSPLNFLLGLVMRIDEALISLGVSLPFGGSLIAIARKPIQSP